MSRYMKSADEATRTKQIVEDFVRQVFCIVTTEFDYENKKSDLKSVAASCVTLVYPFSSLCASLEVKIDSFNCVA